MPTYVAVQSTKHVAKLHGSDLTTVTDLSLVPRRGGGGGERVPGTHCLCMRVIIAKATWWN